MKNMIIYAYTFFQQAFASYIIAPPLLSLYEIKKTAFSVFRINFYLKYVYNARSPCIHVYTSTRLHVEKGGLKLENRLSVPQAQAAKKISK